jgi:hypothetical protein
MSRISRTSGDEDAVVDEREEERHVRRHPVRPGLCVLAPPPFNCQLCLGNGHDDRRGCHVRDSNHGCGEVRRLTTLTEQVDTALSSWGDLGEVTLDTGLDYGDGEPVRITLRKRGRRLVFSDEGRAVRKAGVSGRDWLEVAERTAALDGMNVNRMGAVFAPAVLSAGRDLAKLAQRLAETSLAVYKELLELGA